MFIWMHVDPKAAVLAGRATSGLIRLDLSEEQLSQLSAEERAQLAEAPGLGQEALPRTSDVAHTGESVGIRPSMGRPDYLGLREGEQVAEATFASLRTVLAVRVQRAVEAHEAETQRRQAAESGRERVREAARQQAEAFLATHERMTDEQLVQEAGQLHRSEWYYGLPPLFELKVEMEGLDWELQREFEDSAWRAHPELRRRIDAVEKRRRDAVERDKRERFERARREQEAAERKAIEVRRAARAEEERRVEALRSFAQLHGDAGQRVRAARGPLPEREALRIVEDHLFARITAPRYTPFRSVDIKHAKSSCLWSDVELNREAERADSLPELEAQALEAWRDILNGASESDAPAVELAPGLYWAKCTCCHFKAERYIFRTTATWEGWSLYRDFLLVKPPPALRLVPR